MEQYVKVEKPKVETPIDENEIRITSQGRMRNYISYAMTLLQVYIFSGTLCAQGYPFVYSVCILHFATFVKKKWYQIGWDEGIYYLSNWFVI